MHYYVIFIIIINSFFNSVSWAEAQTPETALLNDTPAVRSFKHPHWFKQSFLNLPEDIAEAKERGKLGIIIYFGQENCPYCEYLLNVNWTEREDIANYTRHYFDVIAIDIWGSLPVITTKKKETTEQDFASLEDTRFTPTLLFYDTQGKEIFRLRGYYPPYKFRAALDYVVGQYYEKETFSAYLERANPPELFDLEDLNENDIFNSPPYMLDRSRVTASNYLAVFFEQGMCHACDIMHTHHLQQARTLRYLKQMDLVQLDILSDTPVKTPTGERLTAHQWARKLDIFYTPTIVIFDEKGQEVARIDSIVGLHRLNNMLQYVLSKDYLLFSNYQRWRVKQNLLNVQ